VHPRNEPTSIVSAVQLGKRVNGVRAKWDLERGFPSGSYEGSLDSSQVAHFGTDLCIECDCSGVLAHWSLPRLGEFNVVQVLLLAELWQSYLTRVDVPSSDAA